MTKAMVKLVLFAILIVFAVMYGMELANSGIRNVYGPVDGSGSTVTTDAEGSQTGSAVRSSNGAAGMGKTEQNQAGTGNNSRSNYYAQEPPGVAYDPNEVDNGSVKGGRVTDPLEIPRNDRQPVVDRIAGKTAETLQQLSKSGVKMIVSLFDKASGA